MNKNNSFFRRFGLLTSGSSVYMTAALVILMFGFATAVLMTARHYINDDDAVANGGVEAVSVENGADPQSAEAQAAAQRQAAEQALIAATPGAVGVNAQGQPVDQNGNVITVPGVVPGDTGGEGGTGGTDLIDGVNGTLNDTLGTVNDTVGGVTGTVNDTVGDVTDTVNELPLPLELPPIEVPEVEVPPIVLPTLPLPQLPALPGL